MRIKITLLALIAALMIGVVQTNAVEQESAKPKQAKKAETPSLGDPAAPLKGLKYIKGSPVKFEKDKVYVVEFWATWCGPCLKSIPHLTEIQKKYKDKGVTVIGISTEKDLEKVKGFVTKQGSKMDYTVAADPDKITHKNYMEAYGRGGIPSAFIVDGKGRIVWHGHPMADLDEVLAQVLDGTFDLEAYKKANAEKDKQKKKPAPKVDIPPLGAKASPLKGLKYIKGSPVKFEKDKVYVVEFWATWCGPCLKSIPHLTEIQKKYKDKGVTVIGISTEKDLEKVKGFVTKQGSKMDYTVAADPDKITHKNYMAAYGKGGIPSAFLVDGKGRIVWHGHPMADLDEVLAQVLDGTFDLEAYKKLKAEKKKKAREERALRKKLYGMIRNYFQALENGKTVEQARPIAEKFIEKSDAEYLYMFMHNMMDFPKKDARDFEIGLKASEKCVTLVEKEYPKALPKTLDTHARMLYRNDRLDEAIATLKRALKLAPEGSRRRPEIEKRLKKYEGEKAEAGDTKE